MRVALTGATGFIGRYVVAELERRSVETVLAVRSPSHALRPRAGQRIVELDVSRPGASPYHALHEPDVLIHLAWGGLPNYRSTHHLGEELPAQSRFLAAVLEEGLGHLFVAGTCAEYGMQSGALSEWMDARPGHAYGRAKDQLRRALERMQESRSFSLTWGRLFYMYGVGQGEASLFSQLERAVRRGDKLFPMSGGEQLRDYLPVTRVAELIVALALAGANHGIVNICSGQPVAVRDLVTRWIRERGWCIELDLGQYPYPDYEPMAFWGDTGKLHRCLDSQ